MLLQGLQHIHSMGLVHLDIKPDNVFLTFPEPHLPVIVSEDALEDSQHQAGSQQQCNYKIGVLPRVYALYNNYGLR